MYIGSVKFFRHIILCVLSLLILTPTVLCSFFFLRLQGIQSEMQELEASVNTFMMNTSDMEEDILENTNKNIDFSVAGSLKQPSLHEPSEISYQNAYPMLYSDIPNTLIKKNKTIYLTFDDGPSENTIAVLDILDEYEVKACFFVTGKTDKRSKEILQEVVNRGHTIGIHTYSHEYKKIYSSVDAYLEDFNKIYELIYDTTGVKPEVFRFPGGSINGYSSHIYQEIIAEMTRRGFLYYDWNVSAQDASKTATQQSITSSVLAGVNRAVRGVVLMHDSTYANSTVSALPTIIESILSSGYTIEKLTNEVAPIIFSYEN